MWMRVKKIAAASEAAGIRAMCSATGATTAARTAHLGDVGHVRKLTDSRYTVKLIAVFSNRRMSLKELE
jgi:hypothetical protein